MKNAPARVSLILEVPAALATDRPSGQGRRLFSASGTLPAAKLKLERSGT